MSEAKIVQFYAVDETVEYYREHKEEAVAVAEQAGVYAEYLSEEASRIDALELACAIIALAG